MKSHKKILVAFILNLFFSVFELVGGIATGSVAILSDALHDVGDAASTGIAFLLEKKSNRKPDSKYTYGYGRYSVTGSVITTVILISGSVIVTAGAIGRILSPVKINYDGMIIFAIVGVTVNFIAAFITREGDSINQQAVNLHMLEDVLGWITVLIGAVIMRFTDIAIIDPIMSVGVSVFIFISAVRTLRQALSVFHEKAPDEISVSDVEKEITAVEGVEEVHHIHLWTMDGALNCATLHVVTDGDAVFIKKQIRHILAHMGVSHVTVETESSSEACTETECNAKHNENGHHHHH